VLVALMLSSQTVFFSSLCYEPYIRALLAVREMSEMA
jgi:hypothetical protein